MTGSGDCTIQLDDLTTVVRADNPSPMTLEGTNTYVLAAPGADAVLVVDPGPDLIAHRRAVDAVIGARAVAAVVLTHHHLDHSEAGAWATDWGAPLRAFTPALVAAEAASLRDEEVVGGGGVRLRALHTPGHSSDHLCLLVEATGVVLSGDHVLGRGTTVVAHPDGDMGGYLASLDRLQRLQPALLYPAHGPVVRDPDGLLTQYAAHRRARHGEVLAALQAGDRTPSQVVTRVYADVDPQLHTAAERSVRAHLDLLLTEGAAQATDDGCWLPAPRPTAP